MSEEKAPAATAEKTDAPAAPEFDNPVQEALAKALDEKVKAADSGEEPPKKDGKPAEKPAPKTPEQVEAEAKETRKAERIAEAKRVELKNAERREASRVSTEFARLEEERARFKADREAFEAEQRERAEAIKKGGIGALKASTGLDLKDLNQEWLAESDPQFAELRKLRAELAEAKAEAEESKAYRQQQAQHAHASKAEEGRQILINALEQAYEKFPYAANLSERELREKLGPATAKCGNERRLSIENILKEIDDDAKLDHDDREKRKAARTPSAKPSDGKPASQSSSTASRGETRTLTSGDAGKKTSERKLTEEEEDEIFKAQLREAMKKDAEKAARS